MYNAHLRVSPGLNLSHGYPQGVTPLPWVYPRVYTSWLYLPGCDTSWLYLPVCYSFSPCVCYSLSLPVCVIPSLSVWVIPSLPVWVIPSLPVCGLFPLSVCGLFRYREYPCTRTSHSCITRFTVGRYIHPFHWWSVVLTPRPWPLSPSLMSHS